MSLQQSADHLKGLIVVDDCNHLCGELAHDLGDDYPVLSAMFWQVRTAYVPWRATTEKMKTTDKVMTTTGSTLSPGDSSVYSPIISS